MSPQSIAVLIALQAIASAHNVDLAAKRPDREAEPSYGEETRQTEGETALQSPSLDDATLRLEQRSIK